mmetsp:Transcript_73637/g.172781  ORF Transcript_73637/g.172781 Transcript_73637/m.172781 type:complete len:325 (-) Transcript_73637:33-1007(-)
MRQARRSTCHVKGLARRGSMRQARWSTTLLFMKAGQGPEQPAEVLLCKNRQRAEVRGRHGGRTRTRMHQRQLSEVVARLIGLEVTAVLRNRRGALDQEEELVSFFSLSNDDMARVVVASPQALDHLLALFVVQGLKHIHRHQLSIVVLPLRFLEGAGDLADRLSADRPDHRISSCNHGRRTRGLVEDRKLAEDTAGLRVPLHNSLLVLVCLQGFQHAILQHKQSRLVILHVVTLHDNVGVHRYFVWAESIDELLEMIVIQILQVATQRICRRIEGVTQQALDPVVLSKDRCRAVDLVGRTYGRLRQDRRAPSHSLPVCISMHGE